MPFFNPLIEFDMDTKNMALLGLIISLGLLAIAAFNYLENRKLRDSILAKTPSKNKCSCTDCSCNDEPTPTPIQTNGGTTIVGNPVVDGYS